MEKDSKDLLSRLRNEWAQIVDKDLMRKKKKFNISVRCVTKAGKQLFNFVITVTS